MKFSLSISRRNFFDRKAVLDRVDKARRPALTKGGAFVRKSARDLLVYRDQPSAPGRPPSAHRTQQRKGKPTKSGKPRKRQAVSPLRERVFFAWDDGTKTCVIGPERLNKPGNAPSALEFGGSARVRRGGKDVTIRIARRPYMAPALQKGLADLPQHFRDIIRG